MKHFPSEGLFFEGKSLRVENLPHGVRRVVLARPDIRNAFDETMISELSDVFSRLAAVRVAAELRLVILQGEGHMFCAGADLAYMKLQASKGEPASLRDARALGQMFFKLAALPVPVVAAVRGAAIGGGFGLAVCSDYVVAEENAVFATTEVRLGIVPGVISPYVVRKVGLAAAQKFMLTGSRFTADECTACGLVARIVPASETFEDALEGVVSTLLQAGPDAARRTKELMRRISPLPAPDVFEFSASHIAAARCSAEGQEGLASFFEKKQPSWQQGLPKERT